MMKNTNTDVVTNHKFKQGDKARTIWGNVVTVLEQVENIVYVYEGPLDWYHVTKLFPIN